MAILKSKQPSAPSAPAITPLETDSEYAPAAEVMRKLEMGAQHLRWTAELIKLEEKRYDASKSTAATIQQGQRLIKELRQKIAALGAVRTDETRSPVDPVEEALKIFRGEQPPHKDRATEFAEKRHHLEIVEAALTIQREILDGLKARKTFELAIRLRDSHRALLIRVFQAFKEAAAAMDAERELFSEIIRAGFDYRYDVLPRPTLSAAAVLGSETQYGSQISTFRRQLEELGVL